MGLPAPYYRDSAVTIYNADCREILPLLPPVDCVVTDPPYGFRKAEWDGSFDMAWADLVPTVKNVALMPGVWNLHRCPPIIGKAKLRWVLSAHMVNGMTRGGVGFGNWIPCVLYATDDSNLYRNAGDIKRFVVGREAKPDHPSPKPIGPVLWFISRVTGNPVDPFMGSGTTLRAAKDLGRKAIGIEIEERYCEIAAKRCAQEVMDFGGGE